MRRYGRAARAGIASGNCISGSHFLQGAFPPPSAHDLQVLPGKQELHSERRKDVARTVELICPHCESEQLYAVDEITGSMSCRNCQQGIDLEIPDGQRSSENLDQCFLCGGHRFYVQKDFNPRLGLVIFALGVLFSYHTYGITLFAASAVDFFLYKKLPTVIVCYRCRALYRRFANTEKFKPYDPSVALKYVKMKTRQGASSESSHQAVRPTS